MIKVKLDFFTDINMLFIVKEDTRGKICHAIHQYVKANNKYMKEYGNIIISKVLVCK